MSDVTVTNNPAEHRYEVHVDGVLAGFTAYELSVGRIEFTHTEVFDEFGGQGLGGVLAKGALSDVRADGGRVVVPTCPFIATWIDRHADFHGLLQAD